MTVPLDAPTAIKVIILTDDAEPVTMEATGPIRGNGRLCAFLEEARRLSAALTAETEFI